MKTIKKQVEEIINESFYSAHPSRDEEIKIQRLEKIVIKLAEQIDIIHEFKQDAR